MRDGYIRLSDPTTSGGQVTSASGVFFTINGKPAALEGDEAHCPLHGGTFPIVGGDPGCRDNGRCMATEMLSKLACGCGLVATARDSFARVEPSGISHRVTQSASNAFAQTKAGEGYDEHFRFINAETGEALAGLSCILIPENAQPTSSRLDGQGRSSRHCAGEMVTVLAAITAPAPLME